jgi:hypothetical protein
VQLSAMTILGIPNWASRHVSKEIVTTSSDSKHARDSIRGVLEVF